MAAELRKCYDSLKRVVILSAKTDSISPALDATLGWMKSAGGKELPTSKSSVCGDG